MKTQNTAQNSLAAALAAAAAAAPVKQNAAAPRDNTERDAAFCEFLRNFSETNFQEIPKHAALKIAAITNIIIQLLQNATYIESSGVLHRPAAGYEAANFAAAAAIFNILKGCDAKFFNYATHDREVAANTPLKNIFAGDLKTPKKLQLIQEIIANIKEQE